MKKILILAIAACASMAMAQIPIGPTVKDPKQIEWKASGTLPPGAEFHALSEDKNTSAIQTLVRFKAGYLLPAHSHSSDEIIVVISGKLGIEMGNEEKTLTPGGYASIPAGTPHTLRAKGFHACEILVSLSGPFDILGLPAVK